MADQRINIEIGSSYNGGGMKKALAATDNLSRTAGKTAAAVGKISGAFEGLNGTASKSIGAISAGLGALATGGIFGAIIFAVTTVIGLFSKMGDESKNLEKLKTTFDEIRGSTDKLTSNMGTALTKIDKYASSIDKLTNAHQRLARAEAEAKKAQIGDELEKMPEGPDKIEAEARAGLQMARIDSSAAKSAADAKVEGADNKIQSLNDKIKLLGDTIALLDGDLAKYDDALAKAQLKLYARAERGASKDEMEAGRNELKEAEKARNEFVTKSYNPTVQQKNDLQRELQTARVERQAAEQERANVIAANEKKIALAEKTLVGATVAAADARGAESREAEQLVFEQRAYAFQWARCNEAQKELEEATKAVKAAEDDYARKLKAAKIATGNLDGMSKEQQARAQSLRGGKVWDKLTQKQDWWTERGFDQRKADNYFRAHPDEAAAIGYTPALNGNDQNRLNYLAGKRASGQELSKSQQKELNDLLSRDPEEIARKREAEADKAAEKIKDAIEKRKQAEDALRLNVEQINKRMQNLGLK